MTLETPADIFRFASSAGLGSAISGSAIGELSALATAAHQYAESLAAEIEAIATESARAQQEFMSCKEVPWSGQAFARYINHLHTEETNQHQLSEELTTAAALVRAAGRSLAEEIEATAAAIATAAQTVDSAVGLLAQAPETLGSLTDITAHESVWAAQSRLEALISDPTMSSVKQQLTSWIGA